ncbi:MAG: CHAT domain-containing protein [Cyanobacteria bacterium J06592_8]
MMTKRRWQLLTLTILFLLSIMITPVIAEVRESTTRVRVQSQLNTPDFVQQGREFYQAGEFEQSAQAWQQAVERFTVNGDRLNQVMALNNLSLTYQQLQQWDLAQKSITESLNILGSETKKKNRNQLYLLAQTLNIQGNLYLEAGQPDQALETWKKATEIFTKIQYLEGIVQGRINQAEALQDLGLNPRACQTLLLAIGIESQQCQEEGESKIIQSDFETILTQIQDNSSATSDLIAILNLGNVLKKLGQVKQAQILFLALLNQKERLTPEDLSRIYLNLGTIRQELEDFDQALQDYDQAIITTSQSPLLQFQAKLEKLNLLIFQEEFNQTGALLQELQFLVRQISFSEIEIESQFYYIQTLLRLLEYQGSNQQLETEVETLTTLLIEQLDHKKNRQNSDRKLAYALGLKGKLYELQKKWDLAEELTLASLQSIYSYEDPDISYQYFWQLGRIYKQQGKVDQAIKNYNQAVDLIESLRQDLVAISSDARYNFRENIEPIYRELVDLLLPSGVEVDQENLRQARDKIEALQLAELNNFLRESCLEENPIKLEEFDSNAAIIYSIVLSEGLISSNRVVTIISVADQPLKKFEAPISSDDIATVINQFFSSINPVFPSQRIQRAFSRVYDWLIRPLEGTLQNSNVETLVFVLDGFLRSFPMAALYDGEQYLISEYNVVLAPGLQLLDSQSLAPEQLEILIGGLSAARQDFSPLPEVEVEIENIATQAPADILFNQTFTKAELENQFSQNPFPIVHLATHGQFSSDREETFLLTWDDKIRIQDLKKLLDTRTNQGLAPVELLVLSACQTATGDDRAALGLAGLAVRSGARTTVATLWSVNDESTSAFMIEFYQQLLNQPNIRKAEALRQSQLKLLETSQYQHPYFWAPFVLIGNWL